MLLVKLWTVIINTLLHRSDRQWMSTIMNCCGSFLSRHIKSSINKSCALSLNKKIIFVLFFFFPHLLSPPTDLLCTKDNLSASFCQTLKTMKKCSVPTVRAQCCLSCSQTHVAHTQRPRKQQPLKIPKAPWVQKEATPTIDCSSLLTRTCSSPGTTSSLCYSVCFRFNFDS